LVVSAAKFLGGTLVLPLLLLGCGSSDKTTTTTSPVSAVPVVTGGPDTSGLPGTGGLSGTGGPPGTGGGGHYLIMSFAARWMAKEPVLNDEHDDFGWFDPDALGDLEVTGGLLEVIAAARKLV